MREAEGFLVGQAEAAPVGRAERGRAELLPGGGADTGGVEAAARPSRLWTALVHRVVRHPLAWGGVAALALRALFSAALAAQPSRGTVVTANGVPMGPATLASVLLGEQLIHGLDLARSARRPWSIPRGDALRVIPGLVAVSGDYLDRGAAHGLHVSYELRFGPGDRYRFAVDGATATAGPAEGLHDRPDCVITADPVVFLLVGYGRVGQWNQILRGKLRAGGRRPWLALRFSSLLTRP